MSNYEDVYAPDLTEETESTLSGSEQFVMFDSVEGKRAELSTIADYIVANGEIDGSDIPTIVSTIEGSIGTLDTKVGDLTDLDTTDKTDIVSAINEVNGKAEDADAHVGDLSDLDTTDKTSIVSAVNEVNGKADQNTSDIAELREDLQDKADQNGVYLELSAGNITGDFHIDTAPYLLRQTAGGASHIGGKAFDTLVGGSVAVNQLVNTGTTSVTIPSGHKYYSNINNVKTIGASTGTAIAINDDTKDNVIDLTQYFASDPTIADRAYTLEQGTAGSGIAWLKSYGYIRDGYIPYNQGTLQSVLTTGKKVVGFNQWDEEWEAGSINNSTGQNENDSTNIRAKNYIKILPNTAYYFYIGVVKNIRLYWYTEDKTFISSDLAEKAVRTSPSNAEYLRIRTTTSYGNTYNHDICINISKPTGTPKNGDYLPYESVSYPLDNVELRGVAKLVNNEIKYDGDVYEADETVTRRFGAIDLGTLDYQTYPDGFFLSQNLSPKAATYWATTSVPNIICARYTPREWNKIGQQTGQFDMSIGAYDNQVRISNSAYSDAPTFKTAMSGVYLIYEKATPTTETADPFTSPQTVYADGTEEYIDTRTVPIPVGHETKYELDLASKLIGLPWDLSMLAPIENGTTASQAYAQGKYFVRNNEFCKAKTSIASGATFTLGTNYEVTTVGAELFALA